MAMGDTSYEWISAGSTATSADTAHVLYGTYNGLSDLNAGEVLIIDVHASVNDLFLLPSDAASGVQAGRFISGSETGFQSLMPLRRSDASQLHIINKTAGENGTAFWTIWTRRP